MGEVCNSNDLKFDDDFSAVHVDSFNSSTSAPSLNITDTIPRIAPAPIDPLKQLISSDCYIDSLEKKLKKIKGKQTDVVKGKDIINSLQNAREDVWKRAMNSNQSEAFLNGDIPQNNTIAFSIQRKVNPEKQALNPQELLPLVKDDILAKVSEEEEANGKDIT